MSEIVSNQKAFSRHSPQHPVDGAGDRYAYSSMSTGLGAQPIAIEGLENKSVAIVAGRPRPESLTIHPSNLNNILHLHDVQGPTTPVSNPQPASTRSVSQTGGIVLGVRTPRTLAAVAPEPKAATLVTPVRSGQPSSGPPHTRTASTVAWGAKTQAHLIAVKPDQPGRIARNRTRTWKRHAFPEFRADGELEGSYLAATQESERAFMTPALAVFTLVYILLEVPYMLASGLDFAEDWLPIVLRLSFAVPLVLHCVMLKRAPRLIRMRSDVLLTVNLTVAALGLILMDGLRRDESFSEHGREGLLVGLMSLCAFSFIVLSLPFVQCAIQGAIVLCAHNVVLVMWYYADSISLPYLLAIDAYEFAVIVGLLLASRADLIYRSEDLASVKVLSLQRRRGEELLESMLPPQILQDYLDGSVGYLSASATIGFCQIYLRPPSSQARRGSISTIGAPAPPAHNDPSPGELMQKLHDMFKRIDSIVGVYAVRGVTKIETVSKTYLLCAGLLETVDDHAAAMIDASLEIMNMFQKQFGKNTRVPANLRIGIASGNVVGGIIGAKRRYFRVFGDTVNVSARMCTTCQDGQVQMSQVTYRSLDERQRNAYKIPRPQVLNIKGKGPMECYLVETRDDWVPRFGKSVMSRGAYGPPSVPTTSRISFVYHKLLETTSLSRQLTYVGPDVELEPAFQREIGDHFLSSARAVHLPFIACALAALIAYAMSDSDSLLPAVTGVLGLAFAAGVGLSFLKPVAQSMQRWSGAQAAVLTVWTIAVVAVWDSGTRAIAPFAAISACVLYGSRLLFLQFRHVVPFLATVLVASVVALGASGIGWPDIILVMLNAVCAAVCGVISTSTTERRNRDSFLNKYALGKEQASMDGVLDNMLPRFVVDVLRNRKRAPDEREEGMGALTTMTPAETGTGTGAGGKRGKNAAQAMSGPGQQMSSRFALKFPRATVFESDIVGYTALVSQWPAERVLDLLNRIFSRFDDACLALNVEKIETIGDAFMAVVFEGDPDPVLDFATHAVRLLDETNLETKQNLQIRTGIATGDCFGGVIGTKVPRFHVFGEAHDLSIKIEQFGQPGKIIVSATTYEASKTRYAYQLLPGILDDTDCYLMLHKLETPITGSMALRNASSAAVLEAEDLVTPLHTPGSTPKSEREVPAASARTRIARATETPGSGDKSLWAQSTRSTTTSPLGSLTEGASSFQQQQRQQRIQPT